MTDPSLLALKYRREACEFLSSSRESFSGEDSVLLSRLEQSLGQRELNHQQEQEQDIRLRSQQDTPDSLSKKSSLDLRVPAEELHCVRCGVWLEPGRNGTTLCVRSLGRGRTRRRRASRRKAAECVSKRQASVGGRRTGDSSTLQQERNAEMARRSCVSDGRAKNAISITCGFCGTTRKYKALPPRKGQNAAARKPIRSVSGNQSMPGKSLKNDEVCTMDDFVSVKRASRDKKTIQPNERLGVNPKKKPKKKASKSGLLDFLSNLND